jgi:hypothetical protein
VHASGDPGANPIKRGANLLQRMRSHQLARVAIEPRRRAIRPRIVEQDPHRRRIALGGSGS